MAKIGLVYLLTLILSYEIHFPIHFTSRALLGATHRAALPSWLFAARAVPAGNDRKLAIHVEISDL